MSDIKSFLLNKPGKFFSNAHAQHGDTFTTTYDKNVGYFESTASLKSNINRLVGTQQIKVDYSKFENHTFFNSAQTNVNTAFDTIINNFPFDGTREEQEMFLNSLTGFEKYVYDNFTKNIGYLNFSGSSYITVKDNSGINFPTLSRLTTADSLIDPRHKSFTIEAQLYVPPGTTPGLENKTQIIVQKLSGSGNIPVPESDRRGFTLLLSASDTLNTDNALLHGHVVSGSAELFVTGSMKRGQFNHVAMVCDREKDRSQLFLYVNGGLISSSSKVQIGEFGSENFDFLIGSGSGFFSKTAGHIVEQQTNFSGSIDELRFYHEARTQKQINLYRFKSVFQDENLQLYFKFNEPSGTLGSNEASAVNSVVLDSSGNSMHSYVTNYVHNLRQTGSVATPMTQERKLFNPVLFPGYQKNINLNSILLTSASDYDSKNPNLITNLIPRHYFIEGEIFDGVDDIGDSKTTIAGTSIPGSAKFGTTQIISSLLFIWAKQFDELKIILDSFKTLRYTDYDVNDNIPDVFLHSLLTHYGYPIPSFFSDSRIFQFFDGDDLVESQHGTSSTEGLLYVQNQLMRRFVTNIQHFIKSKGTVDGLKMVIRSMGIDPDNTLNIRFYDAADSGLIRDQYKNENIVLSFLNITSSSPNSFITSSYLSGSRNEPGYPDIAGNFVSQGNSPFGLHGYSNNVNDGLFTSGSWTYEGIYKFPITRNYETTQSLARLIVTGSAVDDTSAIDKGIVLNAVLLSSSNPVLKLYVNPLTSSLPAIDPRHLSLSLTGTNIFDGNPWHISFGRTRNDKIGSHHSSSYFLRAARDDNKLYTTSSYFRDVDETNVFEKIDSTLNKYGTYIAIGNEQGAGNQYDYASGSASDYYFLNNTDIESTGESRARELNALVSGIRFWSKDLTLADWRAHIADKNSLGVKNPKINFNFITAESGSFEKLRCDVNFAQQITSSNAAGHLLIQDFSQNNINFSGFNFAQSSQIIEKSVVSAHKFVHYIDEGLLHDKVRIRSFKNFDNVSGSIYASVAPKFKLDESEKVIDDSRLSIEYSIVEGLNKDIINIFNTLDEFNNYITSPENMFSNTYHDLDILKDVYFNRLTEKIYLKGFYKIFQYMDSILGEIIHASLPYKTKFFGTNLTIESHILERSKINYMNSDSFLDENEKELPINYYTDFNSST